MRSGSRRRWLVAGALVAFGAPQPGGTPGGAAESAPTVVHATLKDKSGATVGSARISAVEGGVRVEVAVTGVKPVGFHGFHVHSVGDCDPADPDGAGPLGAFAAAKGHLGAGATVHSAHAGDMPSLYVDAAGTGRLRFTTDRFTIAQLLDADGSAVMVHANPDNFGHIPTRYTADAPEQPLVTNKDKTTNDTGDAGGRVACGVVAPGEAPQPAGYHLVASDGGLFSYGEARFAGSRGGQPLNDPIVGMAAAPGGDGYHLVASDGGLFSYGQAPFRGSTGDIRLNSPIIGGATLPLEAEARLVDDQLGVTVGEARLADTGNGVAVTVTVRGLQSGFHGLHLRVKGACDPDGGFASAGGHLGVSESQLHPVHHGDLSPLYVGNSRVATASFVTDRVRLADLLAGDGTALVVTRSPDNFANIPDRYSKGDSTRGPDAETRATGDAGDPVACGVITGDKDAGPLDGYWLAAADGGVFAFGDADFLGSAGGMKLNQPVVGIAATPTGDGYWLVAKDGGVFNYGDAPMVGTPATTRLNAPVVAMAATPTGRGYWLVAADGGVFNYGDAALHGTLGATKLNSPVVSMAATSTGDGYWLFAADGGVFAYGDAGFAGSAGAMALNRPVVGAAPAS